MDSDIAPENTKYYIIVNYTSIVMLQEKCMADAIEFAEETYYRDDWSVLTKNELKRLGEKIQFILGD